MDRIMTTEHQGDLFASADSRLSGRTPYRRKVGNNTYLERRDNGDIAVRLHDTDVVRLHPDGSITLHDGGWRTVTTKDRMNHVLRSVHMNVFSDRGVWWCGTGERPVRYFDGITLRADGTVANPDEAPDFESVDERNRVVSKLIARYVREITTERLVKLADEAEANGTGGDCWYCAMHEADGVPLGDVTGDTDHLMSHLRESYHMMSLYLNAHRHAVSAYDNAHNMSVAHNRLSLDIAYARRGEKPTWTPAAVRKYLRAKLIEGRATR